MTVTEETSLISLFETKIDEALNCVPKMSASEKLRAVHFWNVISEKLQEIVNNCAADIHAVVLKMGECDSEKILDLNSPDPIGIVPHPNMPSDFVSLTSGYELCSGTNQQYQNPDIGSSQFSLYDSFPVPEISSSNIAFCSSNQITTQMNSSLNSCQSTYGVINNLSYDSTPSFVNSFYSHEISNKNVSHIESDLCHSKDMLSAETFKPYETLDNLETNTALPNENEAVEIGTQLYKDDQILLLKSPKRLYQNKKNMCLENANESSSKTRTSAKNGLNKTPKKSSPKKRRKAQNRKLKIVGDKSNDCVASIEGVDDLGDKSDSRSLEPIVSFVVSNTEVILSNNIQLKEEDTNSMSANTENGEKERCTDSLIVDSPKCLPKVFKCDECSSLFSTKCNLNVHKRIHTGEKPFMCTKCPARFRTRGNLTRHIKVHAGYKEFECNTCGAKFVEKKTLIVHVRRHTGEKPYKCTECDKSFSQYGVLQSHMDMHLNKKSHLCELCGKSFRQRCQLRMHKLRHDNVKKHECAVCQTKFLTRADLERHMRIHTGEKPYKCDTCDKTFTRQQSLNEHKNRHLGVRPYVCKHCSRTFFEMSACYKHEKCHEQKKKDDKLEYPEHGNQEISQDRGTTRSRKESNENRVECPDDDIDKIPKNSQVLHASSAANPLDSSVETYQIIKLTTDALKPFSNDIVPWKDTSATQKTLTSFIENFFVEL